MFGICRYSISCAECAAARNRGSNPVRQDLGIVLAVDHEHGLVQWPLGQGHPAQRVPQRGDVLRCSWLHIVRVAEAINDCFATGLVPSGCFQIDGRLTLDCRWARNGSAASR